MLRKEGSTSGSLEEGLTIRDEGRGEGVKLCSLKDFHSFLPLSCGVLLLLYIRSLTLSL